MPIVKISSAAAPIGPDGEVGLAVGQRLGMRMWRDEAPTDDKPSRRQDYETVGYVLAGRADLEIEGETVSLQPGDSWVVPAGAAHTYRVLETFSAVEVTAPPSRPAS